MTTEEKLFCFQLLHLIVHEYAAIKIKDWLELYEKTKKIVVFYHVQRTALKNLKLEILYCLNYRPINL